MKRHATTTRAVTTMPLTPWIAGAAFTVGGLAAGAARLQSYLDKRSIEQALLEPAPTRPFRPQLLGSLPDAARRYLLHAVAPGTPLGGAARLHLTGRMKPREDAEHVDLSANEVLNPAYGFIWNARLRMRGVPVHVTDYYLNGAGGMTVRLAGLFPIRRDQGADAARSARHRTVAEAVWNPSVLMPSARVRWREVDDRAAEVSLEIDDEHVSMTLEVDRDGRLERLTMRRYGNVGVEKWQLIPYGFEVLEERAFKGRTIPARLRGGWWFGTDRYDERAAASFEVMDATFGPFL